MPTLKRSHPFYKPAIKMISFNKPIHFDDPFRYEIAIEKDSGHADLP